MTCEAIHCFDRATVRFAIYPDGYDGARIIAEISENALRDVFGASGGGDSLVRACNNHFGVIGAKALEAYRATSQVPIVLGTLDFAPERATALPKSAETEPKALAASLGALLAVDPLSPVRQPALA
jgi:hypothetical protein